MKSLKKVLIIINKSMKSLELDNINSKTLLSNYIQISPHASFVHIWIQADEADILKEINTKSDCLLLGDQSELNDFNETDYGASFAKIKYDFAKAKRPKLDIFSSLVALPPLYIYEDSKYIFLSSDIYSISDIVNDIHFSYEGLSQWLTIGHPIDNLTIFEGIKLIPAASHFSLSDSMSFRKVSSWSFPEKSHSFNSKEYVELQSDTFKKSLSWINKENSFLSMTAGLDTRAIFAALVDEGVKLEVSTMTSENIALDAITSRILCDHYGYKHHFIYLSDDFGSNLPKYIENASILSGGLSSIGLAQEVYYYQTSTNFGANRISGNLGNQICRKGVERISMRYADSSVFSQHFQHDLDQHNITRHWFEDNFNQDGILDYEFLLQKEVPFTSVSNYSIGAHYATQQSPYANRLLIENLRYYPDNPGASSKPISLRQMKFRDLKHRFLGHSRENSFQINVINSVGGLSASYPINWGWKASGGISPMGILIGTKALIDALTAGKYHNKFSRYLLNLFNIPGLHEYALPAVWLKIYLKDYVFDVFDSQIIRDSQLFDNAKMNALLNDFYIDDRKIHLAGQIMTALDVASAYKHFIHDKNASLKVLP